MSWERKILETWSGGKILALGAGLAVVGVFPFLLYIAFGPKGGNPIGLALLALGAAPFSLAAILVGLIKMGMERFGGPKT